MRHVQPRAQLPAASPMQKSVAPPSPRAAAAGSFERVVLPHLDAAYNLARWLTGDPASAEDVVQDAMLRALRYFDTFRGGDARAWLLQIVRNGFYTAHQRQKAANEVPLDSLPGAVEAFDPPDPAPNPEQAASGRQDLARLDAALASLPVELRECLVLCELEQLSYREIARITGVPIGTVMSRLWRARRALARFALARTSPEGSR